MNEVSWYSSVLKEDIKYSVAPILIIGEGCISTSALGCANERSSRKMDDDEKVAFESRPDIH